MTSYSQLRGIDGEVRADQVLRDDGVHILTGKIGSGDSIVDVPVDQDGEAYQAWLADGNEPTEPASVSAPVPQQISDRQFFQQLAIDGIITEEQALASNAAVIPAPLLAIIEQMPEAQQFAAKMIVSGATTFDRLYPMTIAIGTAYGMTPEQIDEFFTAAAAL